jgi:transforming growth factor-beta-induced protein
LDEVICVKKLLVIMMIVLLTFSASMIGFAAPDKNIVETAVDAAPEFTTLVAALQATGLDEALAGTGPFTVFAPTNEAFAELPDGVLDKLLANPDILAKVLTYHVVAGSVDSAAAIALDGEEVDTLAEQKFAVSVEDSKLFINDAQVIDADIFCTNGVIHVINKVLVPEFDIVETAIMNDDFNTLVAAIDAAGLVSALQGPGPFTVFAPTDAAFAALPAGVLDGLLADTDALTKVLLYHVLDGEVLAETVLTLDGVEVTTKLGQKVLITIDDGVFVNDAEVIVTDVMCSNGVIHVLDAVLIPDLEDDTDLPDTGLHAGIIYAGVMLAGMGIAISRKRK